MSEKFNYVGIDANGREVRGRLKAEDITEAIGKVRTLGLFPTNVTPASAKSGGVIEQPQPCESIADLLKRVRSELRIKHTEEAYRLYVQVIELDPDNVEAWMGRAALIPFEESFVGIATAPIRSDADADFIKQETSRVSAESLDCLEQACGLVQAGNSGEMELVSTLAVLAAQRVRMELEPANPAEMLLRLIRCLRCVWEQQPDRQLGEALLSSCHDYLECTADEAQDEMRGWVSETADLVTRANS